VAACSSAFKDILVGVLSSSDPFLPFPPLSFHLFILPHEHISAPLPFLLSPFFSFVLHLISKPFTYRTLISTLPPATPPPPFPLRHQWLDPLLLPWSPAPLRVSNSFEMLFPWTHTFFRSVRPTWHALDSTHPSFSLFFVSPHPIVDVLTGSPRMHPSPPG